MGWFDGDSSSDEDGGTKKTPQKSSTSTHPAAASTANDKDNDEIDPLDAYMSGITSQAETDAREAEESHCREQQKNAEDAYMDSLIRQTPADGGSISYNKRIKGERLDVEGEEEATAHWETHASSHSSSPLDAAITRDNGENDDKKDNDNDRSTHLPSYAKTLEGMAARGSLATSFRAASSSKTSSYQRSKTTDNREQHNLHQNDDDDDDDDMASLKRKYDHTPIEPLAKINHSTMQYEPFNKQFHTPRNTHSGQEWRKQNHVTCQPNVFDPITTFAQLGAPPPSSSSSSLDKEKEEQEETGGIFPPELLQTISKLGYTTPTLVQAQTLPVVLSGHDALITASTGSGKTLGYVLPLIVHCIDQPHIARGIDGPIGLILTPTRELALQVHAACARLIRSVGGSSAPVTGGGRGRYELTRELKQRGHEIVVATPGRLIDVVKAGATNLRRVTVIVLDEADKMLDMGFEKQVASVLENIRPDRQTVMLSATFGKKVERVARQWLRDPVRIAVGRTGTSSEHVTQHVLVLPSYTAKKQWMMEMLPTLAELGRMIVFVSTRNDCEEIAQTMRNSPAIGGKGLRVDSIHGDKDQRDRNAALSALKRGKIAALVATDVASRGLDVQNVVTVVNFDVAKNLDSHVHRVGRAGRMSAGTEGEYRKGFAYTLLTPKDADFANILVEAFEREGREVSDELISLARQSRHYGGGGRAKRNKSGLGFRDDDMSRGSSNYYGPGSGGSSSVPGAGSSGGGNYYGPASSQGQVQQKPAKRSRWG